MHDADIGDGSSDPRWVAEALRQGAQKGRFPTQLSAADFDKVGSDGLRPFELATLRLQNMVGGIIPLWSELAPEDPELVIQQGGTVVVSSAGDEIYRYSDAGILVERCASRRTRTSSLIPPPPPPPRSRSTLP